MKFSDVNWDPATVDEDLLLSISTCTIAVLVRGRNAWHGTWVRHWFHNSHIFSDEESARRGAEPLRERGSVFYVNERPALLLTGLHSRVVVFDGFRDEPFHGFQGIGKHVATTSFGSYSTGVFPGSTMKEAVDAFQPGSSWWHQSPGWEQVRFANVPADFSLSPVKASSYTRRSSFPQGSGSLLGWDTSETTIELESLRAQPRRWLDLATDAGINAQKLTELCKQWDPAAGKEVANIFRSLFEPDGNPARCRADLRDRYRAALAAAERKVAERQQAYDDAGDAAAEAEEAFWEAEEFAADPWSFVLPEDAKAADVRAARERATNAEALLREAEDRCARAAELVDLACDALTKAEEHLSELREL